MTKVGIIICARYINCGGGKCLRALREHVGGFACYPKEEPLELVGYANCGGCPGGNIEYVPAEMIKNGAEVIHLATGLVVGYPPCPRIKQFKEFIEQYYKIPVVIGTHPIPLKYLTAHENLSFWTPSFKENYISHLLSEDKKIMEAYN
ncbi:MAG: CGGC domain-containing protein [Bacteroidales bacterium]|jgi:predicted metal-binding protein|nr:CGGC domain-containing protein [Bacteroidales bacterium]MDD3010934.1 CGGC domain-containing protein [Bacteroidales bacterium]MDD3962203.1 CGGC domain-containing protein [Bacteroidales bacterium]MDY0285358.1 CGGC domain-containing protein [Bacteroidales bacterium]HPE87528.1 CGGC domain-containing protein [Bacteroidales bacterium]